MCTIKINFRIKATKSMITLNVAGKRLRMSDVLQLTDSLP